MADSEVAIVTGGVQGLGASITRFLLTKGYRVVAVDIQEEKGKQFVSELAEVHGNEKILFTRCDVTKLEDYTRAFEFAIKEFGRVDLLMNNAGIIGADPQAVINVNVMGPVNGCQSAIQFMGKSNGGKGGIVINTASIAGFIVHPCFPVYCASKHAVVGLTRSYGHPYIFEKEGVIFSAICPIYIDTPLLQNVPLGDCKQPAKLLNPDDVAQDGIKKLLEDRINGSTLVVTPGEGLFYVGIQEEFQNIEL